MDPPSPVNELDRRNVSLFCDVVDGNPEELQRVRWYLNGDLLQELPLCQPGRNALCDLDPSVLMIEHASRSFHGNFTCRGKTEAGWSQPSPDAEMQIYCE